MVKTMFNKIDLFAKTAVVSTVIGLLGVVVLTGYNIGGFSSLRREFPVYDFSYLGQKVQVQKQDLKHGPDRYYILMPNGDKLNGRFISDNGDTIDIDIRGLSYSINGKEQNDNRGSL